MKKVIVVMLFSLMGMACMAQSSLRGGQLFLSLPERNTTHVRAIRCYELSDKVMGKRTLKSTVYYDRQGYRTSPYHRMAYDSLGRLIYYMVLSSDFSVKNQIKVFDTIAFYHIAYTPDGWVDHFKRITYSRVPGAEPDTSVTSYRLVSSSQDEQGNLRLEYHLYNSHIPARVYHKETVTTYDTAVFLRQVDEQGRVILEDLSSTGYCMDCYSIRTYYDKQGRRAHQSRELYESHDTATYQFNILGQMIGWNGKVFSEGEEGDLTVRCLPDGTRTEETQIWYQSTIDEATGEWVPTQATYHSFFDNHGNITRQEFPDEPVIEYDNEYWE